VLKKRSAENTITRDSKEWMGGNLVQSAYSLPSGIFWVERLRSHRILEKMASRPVSYGSATNMGDFAFLGEGTKTGPKEKLKKPATLSPTKTTG